MPNKWMQAGYGKPLRDWLKTRKINVITDFGDLPVFDQAITYPCILSADNSAPDSDFMAVRVESLENLDLAAFSQERAYPVKYETLGEKGWMLAEGRMQDLFEKIMKAGIPLSEYVHGGIYYGIKTGLNEAFVIDSETRNRLVQADPASAEIIKPFLAGRDIKKYQIVDSGNFLILIQKGWTNNNSPDSHDKWDYLNFRFPAIARYLNTYSEKCSKRYDQGDYWWELRACEYYDKFERPKIIIPAIVQKASYTIDYSGFYSNDKTSIIPVDDLYLLGLLNSKTLDFVLHSIASTKQGGFFEYKPMYVSRLPVRVIDFDIPEDRKLYECVVMNVKEILRLKKEASSPSCMGEGKAKIDEVIDGHEQEIDQLVYQLYGLSDEEIGVVEKHNKA
jgi:hypothetical protein